jgi:hypothetical protein
MRFFRRFWPFWVAVLGIALTAWSYMQWPVYRQVEPPLKAGWIIEAHLPAFPRVIGLTGLLLIVFAVVVCVFKCLSAWIGILCPNRRPDYK